MVLQDQTHSQASASHVVFVYRKQGNAMCSYFNNVAIYVCVWYLTWCHSISIRVIGSVPVISLVTLSHWNHGVNKKRDACDVSKPLTGSVSHQLVTGCSRLFCVSQLELLTMAPGNKGAGLWPSVVAPANNVKTTPSAALPYKHISSFYHFDFTSFYSAFQKWIWAKNKTRPHTTTS